MYCPNEQQDLAPARCSLQGGLLNFFDGDDELASEYATAFRDALEDYLHELTTDMAMAVSLGDVQ